MSSFVWRFGFGIKKSSVLIFAFILCLTMEGCNRNSIISESDISESESMEASDIAETSEADEQILFEDEFVKITFVELTEDLLIHDAGRLTLRAQNKSDQQIIVMPVDAYADGQPIKMGSGTRMIIEAGGSSERSYFFSYADLNIIGVGQIDSFELKLSILDSNEEEIGETEVFVIHLE